MRKPTLKEKAVKVKNEVVVLGAKAAKATEKTAEQATDGIEDLYERGIKKATAVKNQIKNHLS